MGYLARCRHGCCCSIAQMEIMHESCKKHLPSEEVGTSTEAASSFFSKSSKACQGFSNSFQRTRLEHRKLNLRLWGQHRPGPDTGMYDSQSSTSINFHTYKIYSLLAILYFLYPSSSQVFHYLVVFFFFPFCLLFLTVYSDSVILLHFFSVLSLSLYHQHPFPCLFSCNLLFSSLMYIKVGRNSGRIQ